jgi:proteasome lid subunit RPN8/RPN11
MLSIKTNKEIQIKVFISPQIKTKIEYLCEKIPNQEWAGLLLYKTKGNIKRPKRVKIIVQDIIPMTVGNSVSADFTLNQDGKDRHIEYIEKNPQALDWKFGQIHSHNKMATFFSGTDLQELEYNSKNHDFYISVIVNNAGNIIGKIATFAKGFTLEHSKYTATDQNGKEYLVKKRTNKKPCESVIMTDCKILVSEPCEDIDDYFIATVEEIIQEAKKYKIIQREEYLKEFRTSKRKSHFIPFNDNYEEDLKDQIQINKDMLNWYLNRLHKEGGHLEDILFILYLQKLYNIQHNFRGVDHLSEVKISEIVKKMETLVVNEVHEKTDFRVIQKKFKEQIKQKYEY